MEWNTRCCVAHLANAPWATATRKDSDSVTKTRVFAPVPRIAQSGVHAQLGRIRRLLEFSDRELYEYIGTLRPYWKHVR